MGGFFSFISKALVQDKRNLKNTYPESPASSILSSQAEGRAQKAPCVTGAWMHSGPLKAHRGLCTMTPGREAGGDNRCPHTAPGYSHDQKEKRQDGEGGHRRTLQRRGGPPPEGSTDPANAR